MGSNYIFSFTPTFTQGLIIGQLSMLALLVLILKYLFLESGTSQPMPPLFHQTPSIEKRGPLDLRNSVSNADNQDTPVVDEAETANWFNLLLKSVVDSYRSKLRNDLSGPDGDEIARRRIEAFANKMRPEFFVDRINVRSVDLGASAPRVSNARIERRESAFRESVAAFDMIYTDTLSVSLSTSVLFHYPMPYFIRLPVTLTISLSLFSSTVLLVPPDPLSNIPTLTVSLLPSFMLNLKTTSLLGSRAKLADVPKLHDLIQAQVRRMLAKRGTWKFVMPWLNPPPEKNEKSPTDQTVSPETEEDT